MHKPRRQHASTCVDCEGPFSTACSFNHCIFFGISHVFFLFSFRKVNRAKNRHWLHDWIRLDDNSPVKDSNTQHFSMRLNSSRFMAVTHFYITAQGCVFRI